MRVPLVRRGVSVEVETIDPAEFDIAEHGINEGTLETWAYQLSQVPLSNFDVVEGPVRIRSLDGFDLAFVVGRREHAMVITIGRIWRTEERAAQLDILKSVGVVAMFRGAFGI